MSRFRIATFALVIALLAGAATITSAQQGLQSGLTIQPNRPRGVHDVTIVNRTGVPIRVKVVGFRREAHFVTDLDVQDAETNRFLSGERIVSVWGPNRELILAAIVPFNRSGTLVLKPIFFANARGVRAQGNGGGGLPRMSIE